MILLFDKMRERFFNNRKFRTDKLNYRFFVAILAVMMFSAALPTISAHAQSSSGNSDAAQLLEQCIEKFQGSDHIYCDHYYATDVAKSGMLPQTYRFSSLPNSIIVYEQTKVTLSGLKSTDPNLGQKLSYQWGQTAGDQVTFSPSDTSPVISFISPPVPADQVKTLTLTLAVDDGYGGKDMTTFNVIVLHVNHPPVVKVNPDQVVNEGDPVSLTCTTTDPDNDAVTLAWGQYSGTGVTLSSFSDSNTSFTAPPVAPGQTSTLLFICTGDDGHGGKAAALTKVTVKSTHQNPTVSCTDVSVNANSLVRLTAGVSNPSGDTLSYYWRQVAGPEVKLSSTNDLNPTFVAPVQTGGSGQVVFQLDVTDNLVDVPSCDVTVRINNLPAVIVPPVANAGPDQTVDPVSRVVLDGSLSTGDGITYTWTQVSGDPVTLLFKNSVHPVFFAPSVDYNQQKVYEFKLTVSNQFGTDSDTVQITVGLGNEPPTARIMPVP